MRAKNFRLWLLGCAVALAGCARCGQSPARSAGPASALVAHVPKAVEGVVVLPDLGKLGDALTRLQAMELAGFAAQLQGFGSAKVYLDALASQAGVDPRSRESMKKAGIAPERGAALVSLATGTSLLVLGVSDAKGFEQWLSAQAHNRLGSTQALHPKQDGVAETVFATTAGAPLLGVAFVDGYALVVQGTQVTSLAALAKLKLGDSLAQDPGFTAAIQPLAKDRDALAYAPAGSRLLDPTLAPSGAALSVVLAPEALGARFFLPRPHAPEEVKAFEKVAAPDLTWMLGPQSVVRARLSVDPSRFAGVWQRYTPNRVNLAIAAAGVDVDKQVMGNAQPGAVAELTLAEGAQLGGGLPTLDLRRTNPFRYVQLFAATGVKDAPGAQDLMALLVRNAPHFGAQMDRSVVEGAPVWHTRYARGNGADVALVGDTLVVAGPRARMDAALPRVRQGQKAGVKPALRFADALAEPAVGFVVDLRQLADSVRALPSSAWGVGGFAIKATTLRWLDATHELSALTGGITGEQGGLVVDVALRFSAK